MDAFLPYPLDSRGDGGTGKREGASGQAAAVDSSVYFTTAHLYVYASEKASKGGGVTLQAEAQSHDQMRTWGLPQSEVGRTRITSTHLCISLEDSDHQVTSSVSCGNKQGLRYHFIFASSLKLCFS